MNLFRTCWMYLKSCLLGRKEASKSPIFEQFVRTGQLIPRPRTPPEARQLPLQFSGLESGRERPERGFGPARS